MIKNSEIKKDQLLIFLKYKLSPLVFLIILNKLYVIKIINMPAWVKESNAWYFICSKGKDLPVLISEKENPFKIKNRQIEQKRNSAINIYFEIEYSTTSVRILIINIEVTILVIVNIWEYPTPSSFE